GVGWPGSCLSGTLGDRRLFASGPCGGATLGEKRISPAVVCSHFAKRASCTVSYGVREPAGSDLRPGFSGQIARMQLCRGNAAVESRAQGRLVPARWGTFKTVQTSFLGRTLPLDLSLEGALTEVRAPCGHHG